MGAKTSPLPIFRADRFELSGREEVFERLIPSHQNRTPHESERDPSLWAVEGILAPDHPDARLLLAVNIGDAEIPHPTEKGKTMLVTGDVIAGMFVSARMGRLSADYPDAEVMSGSEVRMVLPRAAVAPLYEEGMRLAPESNFATPPAMAEPAGRVASNGAGIVPAPLQQAA